MNRGIKILLIALVVIAALYGGLRWFVQSQVEKGLRQAAQSHGAEVNWQGLNVSLLERSVSIDGMEAVWNGNEYSAERIDFIDLDHRNRPPHFAHVEVQGADFALDPQLLGWASALASGMRLERIRGDLALDYKFDKGDNSLHVKRLATDLEGIGDLEGMIGLHNVELETFGLADLVGLQVGRSKMRFTDDGLLDRLSLALVAGPEKERRDRFAASLALLARTAETRQQPIMAETYADLGRFFENGGTLRLSTAPPEPVPWLYFYMGNSPERIARMLALEVTVTNESKVNKSK